MKISSKTTYIFPFAILFAATALMSLSMLHYSSNSFIFDIDIRILVTPTLLACVLATGFYFLFRTLAGKMKSGLIQLLSVALPAIIQILYYFILTYNFYFDLLYVIEGLLLLWAFKLLINRYTAIMNDNTIELMNLLGQHLSVSLGSITKLEQKRNALTLIKEFRLLNVSKKTVLSFTDENLDEYEVVFFPKAFGSNKMFNHIIQQANKYGNGKIRQYTI